jgi:cytochrome c oxidase cbb3-type subunit III
MVLRTASLAAALAVAFLTTLACDPPGKPVLEENEATSSTDFKTLYATNCAGCHGEDGKNGPGRILNDPLYLSLIPQEALKDVLIHGRPGTSMPAWAKSEGGPLLPEQIDALVDGMEKNWAKKVTTNAAAPLPSYASTGNGDVEAGRKVFARSCFMCHGPGAKVGSVTDVSYLSLVSNQMLRTSVIVGRPDLGMPDYRFLKLGKALNEQEITDVVAFLASKRPNNSLGMTNSGQQAAR